MVKKKKKAKKVVKRAKKKKVVRKKVKGKGKKVKGPKIIGKIEHFFGHISVAAMKLKAPLAVGDAVQIKGHTTDFIQKIDSMQIEHVSVAKAKKGQDVGFKVKAKCREGDIVTLAPAQKPVVGGETKFLSF